MTKKFVSVSLTVIVFVLSLSTVTAFADENNIEVGDEVRVVFTIGEVQNAAGVSVETVYNSEYLTAENVVCTVSGSESNISVPSVVKWNFLVYSGISFNNTDVVTVTFKALKPCTFFDTEIMYNCREFINPDLQRITDDPNSLFKVRAVHNDVEYDVHTIGTPYTIDTEIDNSDSNIQNTYNTTDTDIYNNTDNIDKSTDTDKLKNTDSTGNTGQTTEKDSTSKITKTTDTDKTKDTDTVKTSKQDSDKNTSSPKISAVSGTTSQTTYSSSTGESAVNTSGSRSVTVIMLLAVMIVSGSVVVIINKSKYQQ